MEGVSGQNLAGSHIPVSGQPVPTLFYGYTHVQPAEGQFLVPGNASAEFGGQPIFAIPVTVQPVASGQPLLVHQYENQNSNRERSSDPDDEDTRCENCCLACLCCLEMTRCTFQCLELMAACSKN